MKETVNDPTPKRPGEERTIDAPLVEIDLAKYIEQIKQEESWKTNKRNAITVFKSENMRIVLIGLHANAKLPEHKADGIISVQVLSGKIIFSTADNEKELDQGQMVTLHE